MKRVWKPLYIGGYRLYKVTMCFTKNEDWNRDMIVAAKSPSHATRIVEDIYKEVEWTERPYFRGEAFNVLIPESWWIDGTPEGDYLLLLQEIQSAITFETEEEAKESPYGLPFELSKRIEDCISRR